MDLIQALVLALVQGLTEWLPVSSSGHLAIAQRLMGLTVPVAFDVMLHMGTLVAVIAFLWKDLLAILKSVLWLDTKSENFRLFSLVAVGTVPLAVIGFIFMKFFESLFASMAAIAAGLFATGALLLASRVRHGDKAVSWKRALIIGAMQAASIAPGISRSGSTISIALITGVNKVDAFRFSFLLSIPAILGASAAKFSEIALADLGLYATVGMAVAAVSGYLAIKVVSKLILSGKFHLFAFYCFTAGIAVLLLLR